MHNFKFIKPNYAMKFTLDAFLPKRLTHFIIYKVAPSKTGERSTVESAIC